MENLVTIMKELGFTTYEARTYLYLLKHHPATRYELSKYSGVPRSAIYTVIRRLENQGMANAIHSKPKLYMPLPPVELLRLLENRFQRTLNEFKENLDKIDATQEMDHVWNIVGYDSLILKAKELIGEARKSIYLSVWQREAVQLQEDLLEAESRGVRIVLFSFTEIPFQVGRILSHNLDEKELKTIWDHKIILCVDQKELIMGEADVGKDKKVAWTRSRALISIALNHIILDITLFGQRYGVNIDDCVVEMHSREMEKLGKLLIARYPENLRRLRSFHPSEISCDTNQTAS